MRVIPAVDLMNGRVVRLRKGDPDKMTMYSDDPLGTASRWVDQGAEILHVIDIDAALGIGQNLSAIQRIVSNVKAKIQVGGGIRSVRQASELLEGGVWRVILGTLFVSDQTSITTLLGRFDSERVSVALDYEAGKVMVKGWKSSTELLVLETLEKLRDIGATSFLLTSVERDGLLKGPDFETLSKACRVEGANIIASGGIRDLSDLDNLAKIGAWGAIVGRAIYDGQISLEQIFRK